MTVTSTSYASSYDVFLSFRGQDTRHGFTGHLYKALDDKGIHTFIDDEELQRGEEITPVLVKAIQESMIAIIVLSKHYASSSFCLNELATIIHCKSKGLLVIPIFYMVDPSDVRHHKGSFGDAFTEHERRFPENRLQEWKEALHQVANLSGYHFEDGNGYEYKFIESVVELVSKKIKPLLHVADHPVGLEPRVAQVMKLLDVGSDDVVHMVGIHGMGGVGKSILARAVYNNFISEDFDGFCYLESVRERSNKNGLEHLQNVLLQQVLRDKNINVTSVAQGASMISQRLQRKKVLLLVDDVDNLKQLEAIVGSPEWFGLGSRVIITTRDQQLLACHQVKRVYELEELNEDDALDLLTWKAFKKEKADPNYEDVLNRLLTYASGLPLALEVMGSNLFGKSIKYWESAINQYKRIPHNQIQDILKVSFDALQEEVQSVFLDIACCFNRYSLEEVKVILSAFYGDSVEYHIDELVDKSLVKLGWFDEFKMHHLVQEMGRQIELKKSHEKRKRIWLWKDIIEVLEQNKGTSEIEIICLDVPMSEREEIIEWDGNAFKEMKNLKILVIKNGKFSQGPNFLPNSLRVLEWWGYRSNCLPSDFQTHKLVMCNLPDGCFTSFELDCSSKMFKNLTFLKFDHCKSLTQIPDVSGLPNLEKLSFKWCANLVTVHESIGRLSKVKDISAEGCWKLVSFPPIHLTSLEKLALSFTGLESFPEILGKIKNIRILYLVGTPLKELPVSFVNLIGLQDLSIRNGGSVVKLPSSILMMPELTFIWGAFGKGIQWVKEEENEEKMDSIVPSKLDRLHLSNYNLDDDFFSVGFTRFAHLTYLNLSKNNFTFLPECIKEFQSLRTLDVSDCEHLREIRGVPPYIEEFYARNCKSLSSSSISMFINKELELYEDAGMREYCLPGAWIPEWFDQKSRGLSTSFWLHNELPTYILFLLIAPITDLAYPAIFLNDKKVADSIYATKIKKTEMDNTYIFEIELYLEYEISEEDSEKEWNHLEFSYEDGEVDTSLIKATGIYAFKQESSKHDIRFTDPTKLEDGLNSFESDDVNSCVDMEVSSQQFDRQQNFHIWNYLPTIFSVMGVFTVLLVAVEQFQQ